MGAEEDDSVEAAVAELRIAVAGLDRRAAYDLAAGGLDGPRGEEEATEAGGHKARTAPPRITRPRVE